MKMKMQKMSKIKSIVYSLHTLLLHYQNVECKNRLKQVALSCLKMTWAMPPQTTGWGATQYEWQIASGLYHPNQLVSATLNGWQMAVPSNLGGRCSHSGPVIPCPSSTC